MKDRFEPVIVEWEDTTVNAGWHGPEDALHSLGTPYLVRTIGFLTSWNRKRIVMLMGYTGTDDFQHIITIPRGMIQHITYLRRRRGAPKTVGRIEKPRHRKD